MRFCKDCQEWKSTDCFTPRGSYCKPCVGKRSAVHYQKNKEKRKVQMAAWTAANPEKMAGYFKKWKDANPGKFNEAVRRWYRNNRAKALADDKQRREQNLEKFLLRERASYQRNRPARLLKNKRWQKNNPHRVAAHAAKRRAIKAQRTPVNLSKSQLDAIELFYLLARALTAETGVLHHVDHIVPLLGRTVSGLHVPWNLQVITATENLQKTNSFQPGAML